ncbi:MAG: cation transporter [Candidatus Aquicultor sp.]
MAKRKEKGKSVGKVHQSKGSPRAAQQESTKSMAPWFIVGAAVLGLVIYVALSMSSGSNLTSSQVSQNTQTSLAAPMNGVEEFSAGQIDASKAELTTFKMDELAGTDCVQTIMKEIVKLGAVGNIKADYSNKLLEMQYDPTKVTVAKLIDAMIKGQHPGRVTTEKIVKKKPPIYVGGSIVEETGAAGDANSSSTGTGGIK